MDKNFVIDLDIALKGDNFYYDLHNFYSIEAMQIDCFSKNIKLKFVASIFDHENASCKFIYMTFEGVVYFEIHHFSTTTKDINELGYKDSNDNDLDWLVPENKSKPNDHIVIRLDYGGYIRIGCKSVHINSEN